MRAESKAVIDAQAEGRNMALVGGQAAVAPAVKSTGSCRETDGSSIRAVGWGGWGGGGGWSSPCIPRLLLPSERPRPNPEDMV